MPFSVKEHEADARERLRAFWAGSSLGRPALHVTVNNPNFTPEWEELSLTRKEMDYSPAWHAMCARNGLQDNLYLAEAMPVAQPVYAPHLGLVAVLAGGDYSYHDSAWIEPIPDIYQRSPPKFDPAHPLVHAMEQILITMAATVGGQGSLNPPAMLDGLTTLSMFRTADQLCIDLIECPEMVMQWNDALTDIYIAAYQHFYRYVKALGYGDTTSWLQVMAEGSMEGVQCDFSVMLSPGMYEKFVLPNLRRMTESLDYSLYHLDGTCQMRFLDLLRTLPRLTGIQWNPETTESPLYWLDAFKEIRRRGFVLQVSCYDPEEAIALTQALGPDGLLLILPRFATRNAAEDIIQRIAAVC